MITVVVNTLLGNSLYDLPEVFNSIISVYLVVIFPKHAAICHYHKLQHLSAYLRVYRLD
jgi:hypothetical protein